MNLALLLPSALAALLALAIPLLIHLARREQQRITTFAALRWLRERARPRRRVRFDELLLMLLRLLLLAALVAWLARPVLWGAADTTPWTVVVPGVAESEVRAVAGDVDGPRETRWLAPGYPSLLDPAPAQARETASLLRQLDAQLPSATPLQVIVPERLAGLDGGELRLSRDVAWRVVAGAPVVPEASRPQPPRLHIRHDAASADAARYLRAATLAPWPHAAAADLVDVASIDTPWPGDARRIAWLAEGPVPRALLQWIEGGGDALLSSSAVLQPPLDTTFVAWRDADGHALAEMGGMGGGRVTRLLQPLRPADMPQLASPEFPMQLLGLFNDAPAPALAWGHSQLPLSGALAAEPEPRELRPWLALLIALLALGERWLATSRGRGARA